MSICKLCIFTAILVSLSGTVQAVTLFTPALPTGPNSALRCEVVNVSNQDRSVRLDLLDQDGILQSTTGDLTLQSGKATGSGFFTSGVATRGYCKITVEGVKNTVRGAIAVLDNTTGDVISSLSAE